LILLLLKTPENEGMLSVSGKLYNFSLNHRVCSASHSLRLVSKNQIWGSIPIRVGVRCCH